MPLFKNRQITKIAKKRMAEIDRDYLEALERESDAPVPRSAQAPEIPGNVKQVAG